MHHHKSMFSRMRTIDGHGKKEYRHRSHDCGHHRGSSWKEGHSKHHKSDFIKSEREFLKNRKGMSHRLKSDASTRTDRSRDKISMYDSGLKLNVDLERCVRCGKCEQVCPAGAVCVDEDIFRVDSFLCNGCGRCVDGCREGALSLSTNQEVFMN
jgi:ferredoxin